MTTTTSEKEKNTHQDEQRPVNVKFKKQYCAYENCYGHATAFCLSGSFDTNTKMKIAKEQKLCTLCLRQASHKLKDCPNKTRICIVCGKSHHRNLHDKSEIELAIKKKKDQEWSRD